jgi:protein-disulfide isomerase
MRLSLTDLSIGIIAAAAAILCAIAVRREFFEQANPSAPREVSNWEQMRRGGQHIGSGSNEPDVVEFADFECPYCARAEIVIDSVAIRYPKKFQLAYYYYPLTSIHPNAFKSAEAAECAARQGRFRTAHDVLYRHSAELASVGWDSIGRESGVPNLERFRNCIDGDSVRSVIEANVKVGRALDFAGTPAFIIDGILYPNGLDAADLRAKLLAIVK